MSSRPQPETLGRSRREGAVLAGAAVAGAVLAGAAVAGAVLAGAVVAALISCAAVLGVPGTAEAHTRSISHGEVVLDEEGATVRLRLRALDIDALASSGLSDDERLGHHLRRAVVVSATGEACTPEAGSYVELTSPRGSRRWEWRVRCDAVPDEVAAAPVPPVAGHLCLMSVRWPGDGQAEELVLSERATGATLGPPARDGGTAPAFLRFVPVGVGHILTGFDHLAFLFVLLLAVGSVRQAAVVVTGFTVGHSVTLGVAALGVVRPDGSTVEALIGLSVALVATENLWLAGDRRSRVIPIAAVVVPLALWLATGLVAFAGVGLFTACYLALSTRNERPDGWRAALAALFGLLHGFGFAGVLGEGGLGGADAVGALLGFNLGVELGQLALVALAWPVLAWLRRRGERSRDALVLGGSALGVACGVFWLVTRTVG